MPLRDRPTALACAALALLASACLTGAAAFAQRAALELPQTMRAPPLRGDIMPTTPDDGRVGDPLPPALLLLPPVPETAGATLSRPDDEAPPDLAPHTDHDGAVGDLIAQVPNFPRPRPSQTEIDGNVGDLLAYVPRVPAQRPAGSSAIDAALAPGKARAAIPPAPAEMSAGEKQCRAELAALGAGFREQSRLADESGCLVDWPLVLSSLGGGFGIEPDAVLNCQTALALARYARDTIEPAARQSFGTGLKTINHASAYVCRGRVGDADSPARLSEHAFGNAIDIGSFDLDDGRRLDIRAYGPGEATERDFMREVRGAACGPWKTVLGPGTNADHATHFHFDLAQRRRGGTYCK